MPHWDKSRHFKTRDNNIRVLDDERKQALFLDQFNLVLPEPDIFDAPYKCYKINDEWAKIVMGFVGWLATVAVWRDAVEDNYDGIIAILKFLSQSGEECENVFNFQLRQNPANSCQLQQSFDGGENWLLAFDYSICQSITKDTLGQVDILEQQLQEIIDALNGASGNVGTVYPDLEYDASPDDEFRDLALCAGIHDFIDFICELVLEERNNQATYARIGAILLSIASAVLIASGIGSPLGLAIATALVLGYATIWDGISELVLNDDEARELVACCMYDALQGSTLTQVAFENSLDGCAFTGGTNEAQIAGAIVGMLDDTDIYMAFVDFVNEKYRPAVLGLVTCPCAEETEWTSILDFTIDDYNMQYLSVLGSAPAGNWIDGTGHVAINVTTSGGSNRRQLWGIIPFTPREITSMRFEGVFDEGTPSSQSLTATVMGARLEESIQTEVTDARLYSEWSSSSTPFNFLTSYPAGILCDEVYVTLRPDNDSFSGSATLTKLTITGKGTKPPQLP